MSTWETDALLILLSGLVLSCLIRRAFFWYRQGRLVRQSGYLPPRPSRFSRLIRWLAGRTFVFLFVGPVKVVGAENLRFRGRIIAVVNHQIESDAILGIRYFLGLRHARYFIAGNQVKGLRGPLVAYTGGIAVNHKEEGGPSAALHTATRALQEETDASFIIFPQGRLVRNNELKREEFYPGAALLGKRLCDKCAEPIAYLPAAIYYDRDPRHATSLHRLIQRIWKGFRSFFGQQVYGAVIVVGEPIPVPALPDNVDSAMDVLFARVAELSRHAEQIGVSGGATGATAADVMDVASLVRAQTRLSDSISAGDSTA